MKRACYVIEAENGVGLYLSEILMKKGWKYLINRQRSKLKFEDFKSARSYIFSKYRGDDEIDLTQFAFNKLIFRDVSKRFNFFVQSKDYIGYGVHIGSYDQFIRLPHVSRNDIIEVDNTREAEEFARSGFADEYGRAEYYYTGPMRPGVQIHSDIL